MKMEDIIVPEISIENKEETNVSSFILNDEDSSVKLSTPTTQMSEAPMTFCRAEINEQNTRKSPRKRKIPTTHVKGEIALDITIKEEPFDDVNEGEDKPIKKPKKKRKYDKNYVRDKIYKCEFCPYIAPGKSASVAHRLTHTGPKAFNCYECDFSASRSHHLKLHIQSHLGYRPFACEQCSYRALRMQHLKRHILTHTGVLPFSCDQCSYKAAVMSLLKKHKLKHLNGTYRESTKYIYDGKKAFECDQCSYSGSKIEALEAHKRRIHPRDKLLACPQCTYTCVKQSHMLRHMDTHSQSESFACDQCEFTTTHIYLLTQHVFMHNFNPDPSSIKTEDSYEQDTCMENGDLPIET